jgi:hypothetical protein
MSIQYRPDVLLAALVLLAGYLIVRAYETRTIRAYLLAAFVVGVVITVKIQAVALLPSLVVAAAVHPPVGAWPRNSFHAVRGLIASHSRLTAAVAVVWCSVAALLLPEATRADIGSYAVAPALALLVTVTAIAFAGSGTGRRRPGLALAAATSAALVVGLLAAVSLMPNSGFDALREMAANLSGGGVNSSVDPFADLGRLASVHMRPTVVLIALACVAAVVGAVRRDAWPALWTIASLAATLLAAARLATPHYFAPAYMLAIPAVFWLARSRSTVWLRAAVLPLVAWICIVPLKYRGGASATAHRFAMVGSSALGEGREHLEPGQVALTPLNFPSADARYFNEVHEYIIDPPHRAYQFLPISGAGYGYAVSLGLRPRYYVTSQPGVTNWLGPTTADLEGKSIVTLVTAGRFRIRQIDTTTYEIWRIGGVETSGATTPQGP